MAIVFIMKTLKTLPSFEFPFFSSFSVFIWPSDVPAQTETCQSGYPWPSLDLMAYCKEWGPQGSFASPLVPA